MIKIEGPTCKKTNEPPKRANHKGTSSSQTPSYWEKDIKIIKGENLLKGG
jgi:hypothetical protein